LKTFQLTIQPQQDARPALAKQFWKPLKCHM